MKKQQSNGMSLFLHLEKDATWTAQFAPDVPGRGFVKLCGEGAYPVDFYYKRYDINGSAVFERDVCSNREELQKSLSWSGSCHNAVHALWDFDSSKCLDDAIHKLFHDTYAGKMDKIREEMDSFSKDDMRDFTKTLKEEYEAFAGLYDFAYFSSQDLNIDLVGCVRELLARTTPEETNFVAKFVLQHLDHYIDFCETNGSKEDLVAMDRLIQDISTNFGHSLETPVRLHYDTLTGVNLSDLFGKASLSQKIEAAAQRKQGSTPESGTPMPEHDR